MMHITPVDHMHVLRKRAIHRLMARALRRDTQVVMTLARQALADQIAHLGVEERFHSSWREIMSLPTEEIARVLTERSQRMDNLLDSSPFMRLFGYDVGVNQRIDFQDEAIRRRLWMMGRRLVRRAPPPSIPNVGP